MSTLPLPTAQPLLDSLAKSFEPAGIEPRWNAFWAKQGVAISGTHVHNPLTNHLGFSIQLPPPNVTGTLHMGHAFNQTIMDGLARYHRMKGFNTAWIPGTDHAGIATQIVVERQLQSSGQTRYDLGRDNFIKKIWEWKTESGNTITQQMRRMGATVDWQREYFTMDNKLSKTVTETFVTLYKQGLIYRGKRLVNWDPVLKSAVSDLEVENEERNGHMWHILYPFSEGNIGGLKGLHIATTRPETMLADGALAVHPDDERYQHLIGKMVDLPLCNRQIPIIADDYVDKDFGSGCVKITGAHDFNDYQVALRHQLPLITIFTLDAKINENGPSNYIGLDRYEARKAVLKDLETLGFLQKAVPHKMMVPLCTRTGQVIEPMLTDQWFVAMNKISDIDPTGKSITQKAIDAVQSGEVKFVPEQWVNTYNQWMNNIQDWCISRQLWWGHQIPAWYDADGGVYVANTEAEALAQSGGKPLQRDPDVMDTWFSSAQLPFSTLHTKEDEDLYLPSSVLVTGYDIIFFWVARMIMLTTHMKGKVPFKHVYIHGLVLDAEGKKMSKSEGNVLDPVDLIDGIAIEPLLEKRVQGLRRPETAPTVRKKTEKEFPQGIPAYGADALRLTFASLASLGRSINFAADRCNGYRNFCNKLWNATRFVLMNTEGKDCGLLEHTPAECVGGYLDFSPADKWIVSELQRVEQAVNQSFADYRFDHITTQIYSFVWDEYCDWYLEIAKVQLAKGNDAQQRATRRTLVRVLETVCRLLHPIAPYITEELWQKVSVIAGRRGLDEVISLQERPYPVPELSKIDPAADAWVIELKKIADALRSLRSEMGLQPAQQVPLMAQVADAAQGRQLEAYAPFLQSLVRLLDVKIMDALPDAGAPVAIVGSTRFMLHIEVDPVLETLRLDKERIRVESEMTKAKTKLSNETFVSRAPAAVVEQEQARLAAFEITLVQIKAQLAKLA
jgi:valyl-tRNA synthetase